MSWTQPKRNIRERYTIKVESDPNGGGFGKKVVGVYHENIKVAEYTRNYGMLRTFEPFQQWDGTSWHEYALISQMYTKTSVLDLETGEIIAEEAESYYDAAKTRVGAGFCPADFYVPNWWEENDESLTPENKYWDAEEDTKLDGTFGFIAGCHWGDDSSWKIQALDLSRIKEGIILRDDRFGYIELPRKSHLKDAIHVGEGNRIEIATAISFNMEDGTPASWSLEGLTESDMRNYRRPTDLEAAPGVIMLPDKEQ